MFSINAFVKMEGFYQHGHIYFLAARSTMVAAFAVLPGIFQEKFGSCVENNILFFE